MGKESKHKKTYLSTLILLADNIANYVRMKIEKKCRARRTQRCYNEALREVMKELGF